MKQGRAVGWFKLAVLALVVLAAGASAGEWSVLWDRSEDNGDDIAVAAQAGSNGTVYVCGTSENDSVNDVVVLQFDSSGTRTRGPWVYNSGLVDQAVAFEVDTMHGRIYLLVNTDDEYFAVVSFSTADTSAYEWIDYLGGDPEFYPADITLHYKDDTVIGLVAVTTHYDDIGDEEACFYVRCYAGGSNLSVRWTRTFDWGADPEDCDCLDDVAYAVCTAPDSGRVFVAGRSTVGHLSTEDVDDIRDVVVRFEPLTATATSCQLAALPVDTDNDPVLERPFDIAIGDERVYVVEAYSDTVNSGALDDNLQFRVASVPRDLQLGERRQFRNEDGWHEQPARLTLGPRGVYVVGQEVDTTQTDPQAYMITTC